MKIARTFTIDYHLYQELRKKPNQSRIVESSIRRYLNADENFDIIEIPTRQLMAALHARDDVPKHLKAAITHVLFDSITSS